jgi:hypothetical protein
MGKFTFIANPSPLVMFVIPIKLGMCSECMKKSAFLLWILSLLLVSCSHKQTSTPQERLAWHKATLTQAYEIVGSRSPKWDAAATNALADFAQVRAGSADAETLVSLAGDSAQEAVQAGCNDPMIHYLYCRFAPEFSSKPLEDRQNEFQKMAQDLEVSGYSPLLKFYANDRTAQVLWQNRDRALWGETSQFRRAAMNDLTTALQDKTMPVEDMGDALGRLLDTIWDSDVEMTDADNQLEGPLFKNWPNSSAAYFIKGRFHYSFAWRARGNGNGNEVTAEGWQGFNKELAVAEKAFRKAWELNPKDPRIPAEMIEMAVSQQKDRKEMELWFQRAMQLDTNNYTACLHKLRYLNPKWYGSCEDMLAFGHECVSSNWGGDVPLILVDAHSQCSQFMDQISRSVYWKQPDVWADIQSAYERYFQINPNAKSRTRYYYARWAFYCSQWQDFKTQIKMIRDTDGAVDTAFFGGEEQFNKMVEQANAGDGNI